MTRRMKKNLLSLPAFATILYWLFCLTQRNTVIPFVQENFNVSETNAVFIVVASILVLAYISLPFIGNAARMEREDKALSSNKD